MRHFMQHYITNCAYLDLSRLVPVDIGVTEDYTARVFHGAEFELWGEDLVVFVEWVGVLEKGVVEFEALLGSVGKEVLAEMRREGLAAVEAEWDLGFGFYVGKFGVGSCADDE